MTTASAPGKLLLFGEYAVLEGAEAVVAAIDRRARVFLGPGDANRLESRQVSASAIAFERTDDAIRWRCEQDVAVRLRLAEHLLGALPPGRFPLAASVDTAAFFETSGKVGLGSSAAMTAAWCRAMGPERPRAELFEQALALHRAFQGGRGSGVDVAASVHGGLLGYRGSGRSTARPLTVPPGLCWGAVWTGRPADTRDFLRRLGAWQEAEPARYDRAMERLLHAAGEAVAALEAGDPDAVVAAAAGCHRELSGLGERAGLPIVSPIHAQLSRLAGALGLAYKPSGAGGGDFGLVFGTDPAPLGRFAAAAECHGTSLVPLAIDAVGAVIEADPEP